MENQNEEEFTYVYICPLCRKNFFSEDSYITHSKIHLESSSTAISDKKTNNQNLKDLNIENFQPSYTEIPTYNYFEIKYNEMYDLLNFSLVYNENGQPRIIGSGTFGQVFLAQNNIDKKYYAIKHMEKQKLIKYFNKLNPIYSEIDIQSRSNHPNIIKLLYVKETEKTFDLVMEYAPCGTLFEYIIKCKGLPEKIGYKYFIQIVNAIKFLHENNIIHRDIKPENILIFNENLVKLCDFGWAIQYVGELPAGSFVGTIEYMAPEIINNKSYGKEMDLWTLGIFLYELMHAFSPFRPKKIKFEESELIDNIKKHKIEFYVPLSDECKKLIISLLEVDPKKRCTIDGILNSDFVKIHKNEEIKLINNENDKNISSNNISKENVDNIKEIETEQKIYDGDNKENIINKEIISQSDQLNLKYNNKSNCNSRERNSLEVKNKRKIFDNNLNELQNCRKNSDLTNNQIKNKCQLNINIEISNNNALSYSNVLINKTQTEIQNNLLKQKMKNQQKELLNELTEKIYEKLNENNQNNKNTLINNSQSDRIIHKSFKKQKLLTNAQIKKKRILKRNNQQMHKSKSSVDKDSKFYFTNKLQENKNVKNNLFKSHFSKISSNIMEESIEPMDHFETYNKNIIFFKFPRDNIILKTKLLKYSSMDTKKEPIDNKKNKKKLLLNKNYPNDNNIKKIIIDVPKIYKSTKTDVFHKIYTFEDIPQNNYLLSENNYNRKHMNKLKSISNDKVYDNFYEKEKGNEKNERVFSQDKITNKNRNGIIEKILRDLKKSNNKINNKNKINKYFFSDIFNNNSDNNYFSVPHKICKTISDQKIKPKTIENLPKNINKLEIKSNDKALNILYSNSTFFQKPQILTQFNLNEKTKMLSQMDKNKINNKIKNYITTINLQEKNNLKNNNKSYNIILFKNLPKFKSVNNIRKNNLIDNKIQNSYQEKLNQNKDKISNYYTKKMEIELKKNKSDSIIEGDSEYGCFDNMD